MQKVQFRSPAKSLTSKKTINGKMAERYLSKSVEEPLIIIICDSASILHLSKHVTHRVPGHALQMIHIGNM